MPQKWKLKKALNDIVKFCMHLEGIFATFYRYEKMGSHRSSISLQSSPGSQLQLPKISRFLTIQSVEVDTFKQRVSVCLSHCQHPHSSN